MGSAPAFSLQGLTVVLDGNLPIGPGPHPIDNGLNLIEAFGDAGRGACPPLQGGRGAGAWKHGARVLAVVGHAAVARLDPGTVALRAPEVASAGKRSAAMRPGPVVVHAIDSALDL